MHECMSGSFESKEAIGRFQQPAKTGTPRSSRGADCLSKPKAKREEACATIEIDRLPAMYGVAGIGKVQIMYHTRLVIADLARLWPPAQAGAAVATTPCRSVGSNRQPVLAGWVDKGRCHTSKTHSSRQASV